MAEEMNKRIMIVEDETSVAEYLRTSLKTMGHTPVGPFASGEEALEYVEGNEIDCVLMDVRLQGDLDGIETTRKMLEKTDVPIIYATVVSDDETLDRMEESGACGYLLKPIDDPELQKMIEQAMREHKEESKRMVLETLDLLLVEDDSSDAKLFKRQLEKIENWDIDVTHETNGNEVGELLDDQDFDVIFLDYQLGGETGLDILREIRVEGYDVPVIMITGQGNERVAANVMRAGGDDYRTKDELNPDEIRRGIRYVRRKKKNKEIMEDRANRDDLTKLYNRRALYEKLETELERSQRYDGSLCFGLLDLDGFKQVNDTLGHMAGDQLLRDIAEIINTSIRATDFAGRFGGDEIGIVIVETELNGARELAQRILNEIRDRSFNLSEHDSVSVSASIGLAEYDGPTREHVVRNDVQKLVNKADKALYTAKSNGGDCVEQRKYRRYSVDRVPVKISQNGEEFSATMVECSERGLRLQTKDKLGLGAVEIEYAPDDDRGAFEEKGNIRWMEERDGDILLGVEIGIPVLDLVEETSTN